MSTYAKNKLRAIYIDKTPTKTDQSAANTSDINIIIGQQLTTGYAPGAKKPPIYDDFTKFPQDLREALELTKEAQHMRRRLPPELQELPLDALMRLTARDLKNILEPKQPAQPPDKPKEDK